MLALRRKVAEVVAVARPRPRGADGRGPSKPRSPLPSRQEALADGAAQGDKGGSPDCLLVHGASVVAINGASPSTNMWMLENF
jgi:hypothetical protein